MTNVFKFTIPRPLHKFIIPRGYDYNLASAEELEEIFQIFFPNTVITRPVGPLTREASIERFKDLVLPCILACSIWRPEEDLLVYFEDMVHAAPGTADKPSTPPQQSERTMIMIPHTSPLDPDSSYAA
ncbi:uncharacterized protein MELLADRAFT_63978 [Melampsora larici-populina 98AG31]|uniref:Uncharacterized protein n=1 Tax=Melampsora larici-populina (strain 98AG31 / pathotype 3-4-7) TaxID=747676 RepID=F4RPP9_MELLP|nr:uncharacterized protein MELLADRAFT_63978 [Melampsora larici-populina 98AG31]EGG05694.1 hypothetical protein MELLADRAFT_63978 [Melampsora larici-populina 98AG31]